MKWQPIETAPKDGTWVLVVRAGEFEPGRSFVPTSARWVATGKEGWTETPEGDGEPYIPPDWPVTHWMPLPGPPE